MENSRRSFSSGTLRSPRLQRSRSVNPASPNTDRSSSTTSSKSRARINRDDENRSPKVQESLRRSEVFHSFRKLPAENRESLNGVSQYRQRISDSIPACKQQRKVRSATTSPSAWALSPGRSMSPAIAPAKNYVEYSSAPKEKSGGLSGVLRLFRQTKTSAAEKDAAHRNRLFYNRYLQWRFVNARAEAAVITRKANAETKLLGVWTRVHQLRNSVVEKHIQVQRLKQEIKLLHILNLQIPHLKQWDKVQTGNIESVSELGRALRATSIKVPLVAGAKAEVISVYKSVCMAMDVMNRIEATISMFYFQVEEMNLLLNELQKIIRQEREGMEELTDRLTEVASLESEERCLRTIIMHARREEIGCQVQYHLQRKHGCLMEAGFIRVDSRHRSTVSSRHSLPEQPKSSLPSPTIPLRLFLEKDSS